MRSALLFVLFALIISTPVTTVAGPDDVGVVSMVTMEISGMT